ncbi:N-acetylmuramoyl-L-alanine amidase [Novosphingopyxis sp.]|uniref:N-acetylmuramoyl-L-alanine amidase n=1 Tax=Novosphingopyxis sp. TaxID=2709690 RepID=UPI003B5C5711
MAMAMLWKPSPNFNERALPISMLVLHYTGMKDADLAIERMTSADGGVSAHYCITEAGEIIQMVREEDRAWHAGKSYWCQITDVNSASIGIELVNPGHEWGYRPFPEAQMEALVPLVSELVQLYHIDACHVVGHSDIAPARKEDPGELFDWERLAKLGLAMPRPERAHIDPSWTDASFFLALNRYGYDVTDAPAAIRAFERRFRPERITGMPDGQLRAMLLALLLERGPEEVIG